MSKIKFAVVGCGHIGKRHAEMISREVGAQLVALCDVRGKSELGIDAYKIPFFTSIEDLLAADLDMDVVNICTPNGWHAQQAVKVLQSGRHVVVEKPMALTTKGANILIEASKKAKKKVFCVMQNRYSPPSVWIKELVKSGKLGKIFMVQLNCYWNRDERYYTAENWHGSKKLDGGTLYTQFSHFIDMMVWLFGDISNVQAHFSNFNHRKLTEFEDSGIVGFEFVNGGMGCLNFSTAVWDKNFESSMTIIAEKGSVKIGGQYMDKVEYCHVKNYVMPELAPTNGGNDYGAYKGSAQNHHFVIRNVIDVLQKKAKITATAEEGAMVVGVIEKIYNVNEKLTVTQKVIKNGDKKDIQKVIEKVRLKVTDNQKFILHEMSENPYIDGELLSELLGISLRKTRENIAKLKDKGLLRRIGPDKGGYWEVVKNKS